jgi:hypothetical protein
VEEDMIPVLVPEVASSGWPIDYMLVVEVDFSTQSILEV